MSRVSFPRSVKLTDTHNEKSSFSWLKIDAIGMFFDKENKEAAEKLLEAIELRSKYISILNNEEAEAPLSPKQSPHVAPRSPELPRHPHTGRGAQRTIPVVTTVVTATPSPGPAAMAAGYWRRGAGLGEDRMPWGSDAAVSTGGGSGVAGGSVFHSGARPIPVGATQIGVDTGGTRDDEDGEEDFIGSAPAFRSLSFASMAERFESYRQGPGKKILSKVLAAAVPPSSSNGSSQGTSLKGSESEPSAAASTSPDGAFMLSPQLVDGEGTLAEKLMLDKTAYENDDCCICSRSGSGSPSLDDIESQLGVGEEEIREKADVFAKRIPEYVEFIKDKDSVLRICTNGPVVSYSRSRLNILDYKFTFYKLLNSDYERVLLKDNPVDRTSVARVDTRNSC